MTEYFISYYVQGCPYVGGDEYDEGSLLWNEPFAPPSAPKRRGKSACDFCNSFKTCPKKMKRRRNLYSRCSIGDLSEEEFEYLKQECGIKKNRDIGHGYELILHSKNQINLGSLEEKLAHQRLLDQYDDDCKDHAPYTWDLECCFLCEYIAFTDKIRKAGKHGSISMPPIIPQPIEVIIKNETAIDVKDIGTTEAVDRLTEHHMKAFPSSKSETVTEDLPDFDKDGFWEPQVKFAARTKYAESTLRKYREKNKNPTSLEGGIMKTQIGHYCRKIKGKGHIVNAKYEYFVFHDTPKNDLLMSPSPKTR